MLVHCSALTCRFEQNGICSRESILLIDFTYYEDEKGKNKDEEIDDMKCISYQYNKNWTKKVKKYECDK